MLNLYDFPFNKPKNHKSKKIMKLKRNETIIKLAQAETIHWIFIT